MARDANEQERLGVNRQLWLDDLEFLKAGLERSYSHLAWFGSLEGGVDLPALNRRTVDSLHRARSDADAEAAILAFVAGIHDPHLVRTDAVEAGDPAAEPPVRPPDTMATAACAALGYAPATRVAFSLPFESLAGFELTADGVMEPFRAGIVDVGGAKVGIVRIPRLRAAEFLALCIETWTELRAAGATTDAGAMTEAADAAWLERLSDRLRKFSARGVDVVVVDIGGNGGGNDLGDWAARLFTSRPIHSARLLVTTGSAGQVYYREQIDSLAAARSAHSDLSPASAAALNEATLFFESRYRSATGAACDMSWVWRERRKWGAMGCASLSDAAFASGFLDYLEPGTLDSDVAQAVYWASIADPWRGAWDGPVSVLTDQRTGSAAEMFAALMHDAVGARTIGEATLGLGCGFMIEATPLALPHSGLAFRVPDCVRLRRDGTDEVAGVAPDLPIRPRASESARARSMRLLETLVRDRAVMRRSSVPCQASCSE